MKKRVTVSLLLGCFLVSCQTTVNLEKKNNAPKKIQTKKNDELIVEQVCDEELDDEKVIVIERPVYVPIESKDTVEKKKAGYESSVAALKAATKSPENYKNGTFYYTFHDSLVYEIYAQPYHLTDIILEPGEIVNGTPLLSEDETVWELTANISVDSETGNDIQHLFLKPAYSGLDSSLIILTNRRVYHLRVKSFKDTHMAMVKWTYPERNNVWAKPKEKPIEPSDKESRVDTENPFIRKTNPNLISTDYVVRFSSLKKPDFVPTEVYDDGQMTYVVLDPLVLQKKMPVLFVDKKEIANYTVKDNVLCVPRLINRLTLKLGRQKVVVIKKKSKGV